MQTFSANSATKDTEDDRCFTSTRASWCRYSSRSSAGATSHWPQVELASFVAKDGRIGLLTPAQATAADAAFDAFIQQSCSIIPVAARDFDLARRLLSNHRSGLRAGDALHLAVASNNAAAGVYSLDKVMIAAGQSLGLPMNAGFPATI